jgi:threonine dehydratase
MTPPSVNLPLSAIEVARAVLRRHLPASPCLEVHDGADRVGRLLVKAENLMPTGSFKIRGATFRLSLLSAEERRRGVIAYSTGNHASSTEASDAAPDKADHAAALTPFPRLDRSG